MTDKEFKEELKMLINTLRDNFIELKEDDDSIICQTFVKRQEAMLDKLEQDYFCIHPSTNLDNIKKFDADGNLISEGEKEKTTTEQVQEGLLKIFNALVEHGEFNIGDCDFDNEKYSTSLCQIADRLLQIESDRKLSEEYYKNCTID